MRYISDVQLKQWRVALAPFISKPLAALPQHAMTSLAVLLNSAKSPLLAGGATGSSAGAQKPVSPWQKQKVAAASSSPGSRTSAGGFDFASFFNGSGDGKERSARGRGGAAQGGDAEGSSGRGSEPILLTQDYYSALGVSASANADDIKAAFRKMARQLHPDTQVSLNFELN